MKLLLVIFCTILLHTSLLAQKGGDSISSTTTTETTTIYKTDDIVYTNRVGLVASMFTGYGLSFVTKVSDRIWIKGVASIYGTGTTNASDMRLTLGTELQVDLLSAEQMRFYGFAAASYWYANNKYENPVSSNSEGNYVGGLGFGIEARVMKHLALSLESGFLFRNTFISSTMPIDNTSHYYVGIGIGGGIYYSF